MSTLILCCPFVVKFCMPVVQQQYCCKIVCACGSQEQTKWQPLMYHRFVFRKLTLKIYQHGVLVRHWTFLNVLFIPWLWTSQVCSDEVTYLTVKDI